jgi:hypothetical protein
MTRKEIREALRIGREALDDADAVMEDRFRPLRERELGHVLQVQNYTGASKTLRSMFKVLIAHFSEPEPGDASEMH